MVSAQSETKQRWRFLLVGAWNTAFGYGLFAGLYLWLGQEIHYLIILLLAHAVSVTNAFLGHRYLVFRSQGPIVWEFMRFNLSYLGALLLGMAGMPFLIEVCGLYPLHAQAMLLVIGLIFSYIAHKYYSFKVGSQVSVISEMGS
jgi:putative flippase GtrA